MPAIRERDAIIDYAELYALVSDRAAELRCSGIGRGSLVALPEYRSLDAVITMLAILATGAAYCPASEGILESADQCQEFDWPSHLSSDSSHAYVITTSGSTGSPKQTVVTRDGLNTVFTGLYARLRDHLPIGATWSQFHPLTFGYSVCEIIGCLLFRGTLQLIQRESPLTLDALASAVENETGQYVSCLTPSELNILVSDDQRPLPSHVILSGESAHRAPLAKVFSRDRVPVVVNTYAATETSGQVTVDIVSAERVEAIELGYVGHPLPGVDIRLCSPDGESIPRSDLRTEGEIQVSGPGIAAGYMNVAQDRERFVTEGRHRSFHTGDSGRWSDDGGLIVTGRSDRRVKLSGSWIALDAIERALTRAGLATEAAVAVEEFTIDEGATHVRLLIAAVPAAGDSRATAAAIRKRALEMIERPTMVRTVVLERMPRTGHGKIDLTAIAATAAAPTGPRPRGVVERVWSELLGDGVDPDANLFEHGVDSLGVVAAAQWLSQATGRTVSPTFIFDHPRINLQEQALAERPPVRTRAVPAGAANAPDAAARRRALRSRRFTESKSNRGADL